VRSEYRLPEQAILKSTNTPLLTAFTCNSLVEAIATQTIHIHVHNTYTLHIQVGQTASDPTAGREGKPGEFSKLFRRVFPALLELAGDLDVVARQLFEGLVFQLVRWYSGARSQADADALAVLDSLAEGAAHADGGPTRELCIRGVVEFLKFAVKQVRCVLVL
jgi:hypothetical protein